MLTLHRAAGTSYVQIGAGAGDQDSRAEFRDGFTEYVKQRSLGPMDRVILVEPNPRNMLALQRCWQAHGQAHIHQCGVVPRDRVGQRLRFYSTPLDAPHYQVASFDPQHVLRHYPMLSLHDLEHQDIPVVDLASLLVLTTAGTVIDILGLDIEGLDADVILDTDFTGFDIRRISVEHLHLGDRRHDISRHLGQWGFRATGPGIDHNGYDTLFERS